MRKKVFLAAFSVIAIALYFILSAQEPLFLGGLTNEAASFAREVHTGAATGRDTLPVNEFDHSSDSGTASALNAEAPTAATAGNLITGFGNRGVVRSNAYYVGGAAGGGRSFLQEDGKLLVVLHEGRKTTIKRFLPNGAIETYFYLGYGEAIDIVYRDAAITPGGQVIIGGQVLENGNHDFAVAFFTDNGDIAFTKTGFGSETEGATAVAIQKDGKIVVAGFTTVNGTPRFALARYNADLSLDPTFSGDGKQTTVPGPLGAIATAVVIQADGKILVGGHSGTEEGSSFELIRYNSNGSRDLSFSGDGRVSTAIGAFGSACTALALQSDGKILATGRTKLGAGLNSNYDFATVRYGTNGTPDTTFGGDGIITTSIRAVDKATSVVVQGDGKIVVSGNTATGAGEDFALVRYNSNGTLDPTFSSNGKQSTDFSGKGDHSVTALLQPDGKVLLTGWSDPPRGGLREIAMARYNTAGLLDTSFSGDGKATHYYSSGKTEYRSMVVQPDGKIVAGGTSQSNYYYDLEGHDRYCLARHNPDGSLDLSFGIGGKITTPFFGGWGGEGKSLALQRDGKIILGGDFSDYPDVDDEEQAEEIKLAVARYKTDGKLDSSYGTNGIATTSFIAGWSDQVFAQLAAITLQPDGKVVALAHTWGSDALARYNLDGSLDTSFDGDGKLFLNFVFYADHGAISVQGDGKLLIAAEGEETFLLTRLNSNGTSDLTFNSDGVQDTAIFSTGAYPKALAIQADGKIIVAGTSNGNFATVRYLPNGDLDLTFSQDGKQLTDFGLTTDIANAVTVQPDGKIVVGGSSGSRFAIARYLPNGELDTSFSEDGKQRTDIGSGAVVLSGMARSGSRLYAAGTTEYLPFPEEYITLGILAAYDLGDVNPPVTTKSIKVNLYGGTNPYANGEWNNWNVSASQNSGALNYSDATASTVSASIPKHRLADNGAAYGGTMCPPEVLRYASFYSSGRTLSISGLSPAKSYSLELFASRANTGNSTKFTVNGTAVTILTDHNKTNVASFPAITPTLSGKIVVSIASVNSFNYLNGFILTESIGEAASHTTTATPTSTIESLAIERTKGSFDENVAALQITAAPNPSGSFFTIRVKSRSEVPVDIRLVDETGRVVEQKQNLAPTSTITLGGKLKPGIYYLEGVQGKARQRLKLIKLP